VWLPLTLRPPITDGRIQTPHPPAPNHYFDTLQISEETTILLHNRHFLTEPDVRWRRTTLLRAAERVHSVKHISQSLGRCARVFRNSSIGGSAAAAAVARGQYVAASERMRLMTDRCRLPSMFGDASQIGIWDSNKGLVLERVDTDRNATPVPEANRTRIITTIVVSRLWHFYQAGAKKHGRGR